MARQRLRSLKQRRSSFRRLIPIRKAFVLQRRGRPIGIRTSKNDSYISSKLSSKTLKYKRQSDSGKSSNEYDIEVKVDNLFDHRTSSDSEESDNGSSVIIEENNLGPSYIFQIDIETINSLTLRRIASKFQRCNENFLNRKRRRFTEISPR